MCESVSDLLKRAREAAEVLRGLSLKMTADTFFDVCAALEEAVAVKAENAHERAVIEKANLKAKFSSVRLDVPEAKLERLNRLIVAANLSPERKAKIEEFVGMGADEKKIDMAIKTIESEVKFSAVRALLAAESKENTDG